MVKRSEAPMPLIRLAQSSKVDYLLQHNTVISCTVDCYTRQTKSLHFLTATTFYSCYDESEGKAVPLKVRVKLSL